MAQRFFFLLVFIASVFQVQAQQTHTVRLSELYAGDSTLRLEGAMAEFDLSVPLAGGLEVEKATLDMRAVSSIALLKQRSVMAIRFNNATIFQQALDPQLPNFRPQVDIPAELWREGYNTLTFVVAQHYANQCVDNAAPELWSEIDLFRSVISVTTQPGSGPTVVGDISDMFNAGIGRQQAVTLYTSGNAEQGILSDALPVVAQALALRADYQQLAIKHDILSDVSEIPAPSVPWSEEQLAELARSSHYLTEQDSGKLHVLVGTVSSLRENLSEQTYNQISGAYLGVETTPAIEVDDEIRVPASHRLIVSGTNSEQVMLAAKALALMDDGLNQDASVVVDDVRASSDDALLKADTLTPGESYSLADMGDGGAEYRGETSTTKRIQFSLPADFYVPENASVTLLLNFAYGAAFGQGSMMNVLINGELVHGLPLTNPYGESFSQYQLNVPARHLKGGTNAIEFDVAMRAPITDVVCDDVVGRHLHFQLLPSSRIELPKAGHVARQPDLTLFADAAYPMATVSGQSADIYITEEAMRGAALTLSGKLAQTVNTLIPDLHIVSGVPETTTDTAFVLMTPQTVPNGYAEPFSANLANTKQWPYRIQNLLHNRLRDASEERKPGFIMHGATVQQSTLGNMGVLVAQKNPQGQRTGTVFMMAAENAELLADRMQDLTSPAIWGQLAGDFVAWDNSEQPELVMQVADVYVVGEFEDSWLQTRMWLSNHPWIWLMALVIVVIVCAALALLLLRRRNKKIQENW
ncbi:cellulose biosynthesis cyclic di-GMP-binding regulatory protein BcsB [Alteromonas confluentis]|uniref:Cyclic di-GMP-binding protein n=1 Tax=Alteromonas confluentis TaxID=1656094 RepID=A0A1E7Z5J9_9ALTE|nr:cellulose biosynthesis cyclic di-GMP-binding regulatory protein BcsB [Alteromonas confluentis]OFC68808.1 hypothetical protein BFC18_00820 [Alteromonas confluentis]